MKKKIFYAIVICVVAGGGFLLYMYNINQPRLIVMNQVINDNGGNMIPSDFVINVYGSNPNPQSFNGTGDGVTVIIGLGAYYVTVPTSDYAVTLSDDCSSDFNGPLDFGEIRVCTITTNDIAPILTVNTLITNDNGGTEIPSAWTMSITGGNPSSSSFSGSSTGTAITLDANAAFTVSEAGPAGYSSSTTGTCSSTGLAPGATATCTFTNDDIAPKLTVIKRIINDNNGSKSAEDFVLFVDGAPVTSEMTNIFSAGPHTVSETTDLDYSSSIGGDCAPDGSITLNLGDDKICTITNDDLPPIDAVWQYRELERISQFPPDFTFTKESTGDKRLLVTSTVAGSTDAYIFKSFKKSDIVNHDVKITWSGTSPVVSGTKGWEFTVTDGAYYRTSFTDFPVDVFRTFKGAGILDTILIVGVNFGEQTDTLHPNWAASQLNEVTILVRVVDDGVQRSVTGTVRSIEIVGVATWTFTDPIITPEQSGTTNDFGTYTAVLQQ